MDINSIESFLGEAFEAVPITLNIGASTQRPWTTWRSMLLFDMLGLDESSDVCCGWYSGSNVADEVSRHFGERTLGRAALDPQSDRSWVLVNERLGTVLAAMGRFDTPGVLFKASEPGWVLECPPSMREAFLYPVKSTIIL